MITAPRLAALTRALAEYRDEGALDTSRARAERRHAGAYFTPLPLVEFTVAETLEARLAEHPVVWRPDGSPALRILDPCAGDGRFLAACRDYLTGEAIRRGLASDGERDRVGAAITRSCLLAIERDPEFAAATRNRLGPDAAVFTCDALLAPPTALERVDVVVGNPPYVRSVHMAADERLALSGLYAATSFGEWDVYLAFLEQAHAWLASHGHAGLVVPSRWFTSAAATRLRERLTRAGAVRALVDFGVSQVFADVTTYTSISFLSKTKQSQVQVARHGASDAAAWQCGTVAATDMSADPWSLAVGPDRSLVDHLATGVTLGDVARVAKGTGTNADRVYVVEQATIVGDRVIGRCRASTEPVELERAACRPCLRGRDIDGYGAIDASVQCLTPYHRDGTLWSRDYLAGLPLAAAHLNRFRALLEARESGKYTGLDFYRFGRPQNLAFLGLEEPKIVIPDVARSGRAVLDHNGVLVLDSAYAVRLLANARGYSLALLLAILNAPVVRFWLLQTGVSLRGGYVRLKTAYMRSLPLPALSEHTERAEGLVGAGLVTDASAQLAIDDAIRQAYGLDPATWRRLGQ